LPAALPAALAAGLDGDLGIASSAPMGPFMVKLGHYQEIICHT
jgi:hypothetical protein